MPDPSQLVLCHGRGCPMKENCLRYTSVPEIRQKYFKEMPYDEEQFDCKYQMLPDHDDEPEAA